jgi:uncharacterized protein (TIGR03067 family)
MKKWTLALALATVALTSAVALAQQTSQTEVPKELAQYQGAWIVDQLNGNALPVEMALVIDGGRYAQTIDGTVTETGQFKVDATKSPHHVTLVIEEGDDAGKSQLGIIDVKDNTVRCLLNAPGDATRPTSLEKGDGELYVIAHKKKT